MRSFGYYVRSFRTNVWSSMANVWSGFRKTASYCVVVNDRSLGIMRISGDGGGRPCAVFRRSVHTFVPKRRTFPLELRTFIQGIRMTARCRALPPPVHMAVGHRACYVCENSQRQVNIPAASAA